MLVTNSVTNIASAGEEMMWKKYRKSPTRRLRQYFGLTPVSGRVAGGHQEEMALAGDGEWRYPLSQGRGPEIRYCTGS